MSVIAFKHGVLAADSRAYGGNWQASPGQKTKIHLLADGSRVGITSAAIGTPERFLAWLRAGADPAKWTGDKPECRALMVKPSGEVFLASDSVHFSGPITSDCYAIGSGCDFAMGAMLAGASSEEAVRIACRLDPHCGEPVMTLHPNSLPPSAE